MAVSADESNPRHVKARAKVIVGLVVVCLAAIVFEGFSWPQRAGNYEATVVSVPQGASLATVAQMLEQRGIIERAWMLRQYARLSGYDRRLQAGTYDVPANLSAAELLQLFASGRVQQHPVRLPEGVTVADLLLRLRSESVLTQSVANKEDLRQRLVLELPFVEGAFFPDTYLVTQGTLDIDLLQRGHETMMVVLAELWKQKDPDIALQTPAQALILASIIEKESDAMSDRRQISQVFHLRLKKNMRLQTDPTVIFALGEAFDGDLRRRDLRVDSPFNTYRYRGLPPTPIALPSLSSIEAALHPAAGNYLYFVARGDGTSQFSRTLAEHNAAVRRYQLSGRGAKN